MVRRRFAILAGLANLLVLLKRELEFSVEDFLVGRQRNVLGVLSNVISVQAAAVRKANDKLFPVLLDTRNRSNMLANEILVVLLDESRFALAVLVLDLRLLVFPHEVINSMNGNVQRVDEHDAADFFDLIVYCQMVANGEVVLSNDLALLMPSDGFFAEMIVVEFDLLRVVQAPEGFVNVESLFR